MNITMPREKTSRDQSVFPRDIFFCMAIISGAAKYGEPATDVGWSISDTTFTSNGGNRKKKRQAWFVRDTSLVFLFFLLSFGSVCFFCFLFLCFSFSFSHNM